MAVTVPRAGDLSAARSSHRSRAIRWGFMWGLWNSILWGVWYLPGTAIWSQEPFVSMGSSAEDFLVTAAVISALSSLAVTVFVALWLTVLGKWKDFGRTFVRFRKISKWYFVGAIFGGPCAIFGSFLAMGYIGGVFAAVACLVYPIVGAGLARVWYHEKITRRAALGIFIIVGGAIYIYAPGILGELSGAGSSAWLGYLGGFMAAIGWGVEGAVGGRALDVSDPDVGVSIRFMVEPLYWVFIIIPIAILLAGSKVTDLILASFTPTNLILFMTIGITYGYCTISWYKAFPLIGVGRTQAISDTMAIWAVAFLSIFTLTLPPVNYWLGGIVVILGGVVMFTENRQTLDCIRSVDTTTDAIRPAPDQVFAQAEEA
jgi:drug/metabolite transporter (DMT)-like permease